MDEALIRRDNLTFQVKNFIGGGLMSGRFKPGERLTIRGIADVLGVSSTPVREALLQLVNEQALELRQNRSFTVPVLSLSRYLEIRDIRAVLEGHAAETAARVASSEEIEELSALHVALAEAELKGDNAAALDINQRFHLSLARASHLPILIALIESLWLQIGPFLNNLYPRARHWREAIHQHERVVEGLRMRDGALAREAIRMDLIEGGADLLRVFDDPAQAANYA